MNRPAWSCDSCGAEAVGDPPVPLALPDGLGIAGIPADLPRDQFGRYEMHLCGNCLWLWTPVLSTVVRASTFGRELSVAVDGEHATTYEVKR